MLVVDRAFAGERLGAATEQAFRGGVDALQIRERALEGRELLHFATELAGRARRGAEAAGRSARVLVNRRCDIALALGADGVHLGFDAIGAADARRLFPSGWVGVSAHSIEEVEGAERAGADYAQLAPIFDPRSKAAERPALGIERLRRAAAGGLPVIAQGGATPERCGELVDVGAAGVAVTGALLASPDPEATARAFRLALDR